MKRIAMIGVGKLGQDCAEVMAEAGNDVVGYDIETRTPAFPMMATIAEAVKDRDLIFIAAPTPHDPIYGGETPTSHLPNRDFDYTIVKGILEEVNKHVNKSQLVVLISTVLPGTVRSLLYPCLTNARFIYNPYLIAMGTVKWDMVNPEMVIIGTEDGSITGDAHELIEFYKPFMQNDPRYEVGTWDEAESIKIFYNTFISTKLALVNMVQDVAETNGNINVDVVTNALAKSTHRIMGPAYMKAGLGDAGACHPRDNIALRYLAERLDLGYDLFDSIMTAREKQAERMALKCLEYGNNITIIGKAYKPAVPYLNGSASMLVGHYIEQHGGNVHYYDLNTGDIDFRANWTHVYLIGYWEQWVEEIKFPGECTVIDPWRKLAQPQHFGEIIHYGDTRKKKGLTFETEPEVLQAMQSQLYQIWPELVNYEKKTHYIYGAVESSRSFVKRPIGSILNEIRNAIRKEGKSKFIFLGHEEALLIESIVKIHRILDILGDEVKPHNLFFTTSSIDGDRAYNNLCERLGYSGKRITILSCHGFERNLHHGLKGIFDYTDVEPNATKEKLFLSFNKVNREHRMWLVESMLENDLLKDAFYSFEGEEGWIDRIKQTDEFPNIRKNIDLFPLRLNINPNRTNPVDVIPDDIQYHKNSYFSVVTETIFFDNNTLSAWHKANVEDSIFFTEKTFKCFALKHPFILLGRPHCLPELHKAGYKTFSPLIDESYDTVENNQDRFNLIVKEIKRLCSFTKEEWDEWSKKIKEIVDYNHAHFYSRKGKGYSGISIKEYFKDVEECNSGNIVYLADSTPDYVKLEDTNVDKNWTMLTRKVSGDIEITFPVHLDGGGFEMKDDLVQTIGTNRIYEKCYEWCAGFGVLGYEILGKGVAKSLAFSDYYDVAIRNCIDTAVVNKLSDKVVGYVTPVVEHIPEYEKFDLVVSNPPHMFIRSDFFEAMDPKVHTDLGNAARLLVDDNLGIHREFFGNIRKNLTNDADLFIIEAHVPDELRKIIEENGFYIVAEHPISFGAPHSKTMHIKIKN